MYLTEDLDLTAQLTDAQVADTQLLSSEALSMVINTGQVLSKDDNPRLVLTTSNGQLADYSIFNQQVNPVGFTKHELIDETGQNTQTIQITTNEDQGWAQLQLEPRNIP